MCETTFRVVGEILIIVHEHRYIELNSENFFLFENALNCAIFFF